MRVRPCSLVVVGGMSSRWRHAQMIPVVRRAIPVPEQESVVYSIVRSDSASTPTPQPTPNPPGKWNHAGNRGRPPQGSSESNLRWGPWDRAGRIGTRGGGALGHTLCRAPSPCRGIEPG